MYIIEGCFPADRNNSRRANARPRWGSPSHLGRGRYSFLPHLARRRQVSVCQSFSTRNIYLTSFPPSSSSSLSPLLFLPFSLLSFFSPFEITVLDSCSWCFCRLERDSDIEVRIESHNNYHSSLVGSLFLNIFGRRLRSSLTYSSSSPYTCFRKRESRNDKKAKSNKSKKKRKSNKTRQKERKKEKQERQKSSFCILAASPSFPALLSFSSLSVLAFFAFPCLQVTMFPCRRLVVVPKQLPTARSRRFSFLPSCPFVHLTSRMAHSCHEQPLLYSHHVFFLSLFLY